MRASRLFVLRALVLAITLAVVHLTPAAAQNSQFSDAKLQSFVAADLKVGEVVDRWVPRINAASSPGQAAQLKEQANAELVQTIKSSGGITVEEFSQISQSAASDPSLQQRIDNIMQSKR